MYTCAFYETKGKMYCSLLFSRMLIFNDSWYAVYFYGSEIQLAIFQEKSKAMLQIRFDETPYKKPVRVSIHCVNAFA